MRAMKCIYKHLIKRLRKIAHTQHASINHCLRVTPSGQSPMAKTKMDVNASNDNNSKGNRSKSRAE
jgi:hypothetical protein